MKRFINQLNVSITTNRTCNLHCTHCYIMPEMFKNKNRISKENFKKIFDIISSLNKIDTNLEEIEWETLGGETTLMPFEFWEELLPYSLGRVTEINSTLEKPGSMNFITNLMVKDPRYFELFNSLGREEFFSIYTSWEPDTERFGKNNEKLPKYYENLKRIKGVENKTLDIIFTKKIIELGPKYILDTFLPFGIRDFSFKMISPFGSGRQFFVENMTDFKSMEKYLRKFDLLSQEHEGITFTPQEEMLSSIHKNESFQCNGNFYYDLSIEPEGLITFNASQTLSESVYSYNKTLNVNEKNVEYKIMFENIPEAFNKLELTHKECDGCEYLIYCNAGWYHYKINKEAIVEHSLDECSGLKTYWDFNLKGQNMDFRMPKLKKMAKRSPKSILDEGDMAEDYEGYFEKIKKLDRNKECISLQEGVVFGKSILERVLFFDGLDIDVNIKEDIFERLSSQERSILIKNIINNNYKIKIISSALLKKGLLKNTPFLHNLKIVMRYMNDRKVAPESVGSGKPLVDFRMIEQYIFIMENIDFLGDLIGAEKNSALSFTKYEMEYLDYVFAEFEKAGRVYPLD